MSQLKEKEGDVACAHVIVCMYIRAFAFWNPTPGVDPGFLKTSKGWTGGGGGGGGPHNSLDYHI